MRGPVAPWKDYGVTVLLAFIPVALILGGNLVYPGLADRSDYAAPIVVWPVVLAFGMLGFLAPSRWLAVSLTALILIVIVAGLHAEAAEEDAYWAEELKKPQWASGCHHCDGSETRFVADIVTVVGLLIVGGVAWAATLGRAWRRRRSSTLDA